MTKNLIDALSKYIIPYPKGNIDDCRIYRWGRNNRYWLKRFDGGYVFGDFVNDVNTQVFDDDNADIGARKDAIEKARREIEEERKKTHEEAAVSANNIWNKASPATFSHGYLEKKHVNPYGIRKYENELVIPLCYESGKIWSLQFIDESGRKSFLSGGRKKGCYFVIDPANGIANSEEIFVCEGYATGSTIYECTETPVVVAFDAGNLRDVIKAIRKKYKDKKIIICADNDQYSENGINVGLEKAIAAAKEIDAYVVKPVFSDIATKPTDFNDLFLLEGLDKVKECIYSYNQAVKPALAELYLNKYNNIYSNIENFLLSESCLFYINPKTKEELYICDHIQVIALTEEMDTRKTGRLVEFKTRRNKLKKLNILDEWLSKDGDLIRSKLMSAGFKISTENFARRKLNEYLNFCESDQYAKCVSLTGWHSDCFLTPIGIIGGNTSNSILLNQSENEDSYICEKGNLDEWKENVSKYCIGNSRLILSVSFSFASILIKPCARENCGIHFVGESSQGKTSSLYLAASVFGSPEYIKTWRSTDNALEGLAVSHNDMLLILDEMAEMNPKKIGEAAYMLCNGKGKSRLNSSISLRKQLRWRLGVLSTGEIDIATHMESGGRKSHAGQELRLLSIPAKPCENSYGVFENIHEFETAELFANYLKDAASNYYGSPLVEFAKKVIADYQKIKPWHDEAFKTSFRKHLPEKAAEQDIRAFRVFYFIAFAGELATRYGITGWLEGEALSASLKCFQAWLDNKGGTGNFESKRILEQIKSFLELHGCSRFHDLAGFDSQHINNMAGYKEIFQGETTFYLLPTIFKKEVCKGINHKDAISLLIKEDVLLVNDKGEYYQQKRTPHGNKRVYIIKGELL